MLGAAAVSAVLPILVYLWPYSKSKQGMKIDIKLSEALGQLKDNVPIKFNAPTGKAFVLASGGGDNAVGDPAFAGWVIRGSKTGDKTLVFAVNCPHLGCSVGFDSQLNVFKCPCHGSRFALDGAVIKGPATAPMAHLSWNQTAKPNTIAIRGEDLVA